MDPKNNYRMDSQLVEPEITLVDLCNFNALMGNGFSTLIGYGGGIVTFMRGLRAVNKLGVREYVEVMQEALNIMISEGLEIPSNLEHDIDSYDEVDFDLEQSIAAKTSHLDSRFWKIKVDIDLILLKYLQEHRDLLLIRRQAEQDAPSNP